MYEGTSNEFFTGRLRPLQTIAVGAGTAGTAGVGGTACAASHPAIQGRDAAKHGTAGAQHVLRGEPRRTGDVPTQRQRQLDHQPYVGRPAGHHRGTGGASDGHVAASHVSAVLPRTTHGGRSRYESLERRQGCTRRCCPAGSARSALATHRGNGEAHRGTAILHEGAWRHR